MFVLHVRVSVTYSSGGSHYLTSSPVAICYITFVLRHMLACTRKHTGSQHFCGLFFGFLLQRYPSSPFTPSSHVCMVVRVNTGKPKYSKYASCFICLVVFCLCGFTCFLLKGQTDCSPLEQKVISNQLINMLTFFLPCKDIKQLLSPTLHPSCYVSVWSHLGTMMRSLALTFCYPLPPHMQNNAVDFPMALMSANEGFTSL